MYIAESKIREKLNEAHNLNYLVNNKKSNVNKHKMKCHYLIRSY